ncbi:MAG: CoA-binding protein [Phycisphaerales bacterium]|nr:CoA-binding protein [Phycisphaerales bacterium]
MAIIIDETKKVMIQGITGREGRARTRLMREFGTNVVGGCTPGKGGQEVEGIAVHDKVSEVIEATGGVDVSVVFVPARLVKSAAVEAIEAGVKLVMLVPDRVPLWDAMAIAECAAEHGAEFIGPNTLGVISPGRAVLGMIGGRAESARQWFNEPIKGRTVGVISRSGGMSSSCGYYLSRAGLGISTICHVGGDSVLGLTFPEVALKFQDDPETDAIVLFGEIGGSMEERLADLMASGKITKPVVAYIGGKAAKEGTRFSHAGAIIEGDRGTHAGKVKALTAAGAVVVDGFGDLPDAALSVFATKTSS